MLPASLLQSVLHRYYIYIWLVAWVRARLIVMFEPPRRQARPAMCTMGEGEGG
ncbi:hypothetical protein LZ31DRAFT_159644 [Colletotrichum somersetense]|nr:hypothetical protein LZ31DRAFT_159644 [Colletotrichum somersetense]